MAKMVAMGAIVNSEAEVMGAAEAMVAIAPQVKVVMAVMEEMRNDLTWNISGQGGIQCPPIRLC